MNIKQVVFPKKPATNIGIGMIPLRPEAERLSMLHISALLSTPKMPETARR